MKKKQNIFTMILFGIVLLVLVTADIIQEDIFFSPNENRILTAKPDFSRAGLFEGTYTKDYESYVTDQFVGRDEWIRIKTYSEILLQKKEINGVYLGKDNYLFEQHSPIEIDNKKAEEKKETLQKELAEYETLLNGGMAKAMLIPTADIILEEKLPSFAGIFDQREYLSGLSDHFIMTEETLNTHKTEYIYYKTDHHWTTLGAYYGYQAWAKAMELSARPISFYERKTLSDNFLGTLHSKINIAVKPDTIEIFQPKEERKYKVYYDLSKEHRESLYEESHLQTKNQYGVFLDDNHGLIEIQTEPSRNQRSILVIKNSYANCFIPFLTEHYDTVYVLDKRYYRGDVKTFLAEQEIHDLLVLYDVINFIKNY